jgi:2,5-diketo-D-gluconate reductase A
VRSIGVSNFTAGHIERLVEETGVLPAVNQVELHPAFAQPELRAWHDANGVITEAWSPLGPDTDILSNPALGAIAAAHGRTAAQVILRWHIQIGDIPIPKSAHPDRMGRNIAVFDFELTPDQMAALAAIDHGHRTGGDPDTNVEL